MKFARFGIGLVSAAFSAALLVALAAFAGLWMLSRDLPDYQKLARYEPPIVSRVYAADGSLIGEFASEKRVFVPYEAVPKRVVDAFVAAEDQRFFTHPGVDPIGIVRVIGEHYFGGERLRGASTITQQVAKNFLLTPERSMTRKLREMMLSFRIERAFSKQKILELYLNEIFLGRRSFGVAAAAQTYFRKSLGELTVAEAALLAALPQAPSRLDPRRNAGGALARRDYVIGRMRAEGYITAAEAEEARNAPLGVEDEAPYVSLGTEFFVEDVRRELIAKYGEARMAAGGFVVRATVEPRIQRFADAALRRGLVAYDRRHGWRGAVANLVERHGEGWAEGWRRRLRAVAAPAGHGDWPLAVVLEVDREGVDIGLADGRRGRIPLSELAWARKQGDVPMAAGTLPFRTAIGPPVRRAADVLKKGDVVLVEPLATAKGAATFALRQVPEVTGALVAMDPHTGRVVALSGGFSFWMSQFDNATQAWRQPGSSFKPYVYLAALEAGFTPSTVILDAPVVLGGYKPRNYSGRFLGPMTMRAALVQSRNLVTIRLASATGLERVAAMAMRLGVVDRAPPILPMALGALETTPLRQAAAYSMFVNGGRRVVPTLVDRIQDRHGRTVFRHGEQFCDDCRVADYRGQAVPEIEDRREQVVDPANAYQIVSMLQDVVRRGTGAAVAGLGRPVGGKTGTTNDVRDAWFVGFTPDLVTAVWVGFDQPRTLGPREQGGLTAAPIFLDFMRAALEGTPVRDFPRPANVVAIGGEVYKRGAEPGSANARGLDGATADADRGSMPGVGTGMNTVY